MTDLRFPFKLADRQAALLLCPLLADAHAEGQSGLGRVEMLHEMRELVEQYGTNWGRATDAASIERLLEEALNVLARMKLIQRDGELVSPLPALARFSSPEVRGPTSTTESEA